MTTSDEEQLNLFSLEDEIEEEPEEITEEEE